MYANYRFCFCFLTPPLAWQNGERASTRIVARSTVPESEQTRIGEAPVLVGYPVPPSGAVAVVATPSTSSTTNVPPITQKRRSDNTENGPQAKKQKAKPKPKTTTPAAGSRYSLYGVSVIHVE